LSALNRVIQETPPPLDVEGIGVDSVICEGRSACGAVRYQLIDPPGRQGARKVDAVRQVVQERDLRQRVDSL
jgi:hypothetical protein